MKYFTLWHTIQNMLATLSAGDNSGWLNQQAWKALEKKVEVVKSLYKHAGTAFCLLLHDQVNSCDRELYLLTTSKVRKERLKRSVHIMGMGQVFLQRSPRLKASNSPSQKARRDRWSGDLGSSPTGAPAVNNCSTKKLQHGMPVPPKQICFCLLLLLICVAVSPQSPSWTWTLCSHPPQKLTV